MKNALVPSDNDRDYDRAEKLFYSFHGRMPRDGEIQLLTLRGTDAHGDNHIIDVSNVLEVGTLIGLIYKTKEEAKPFIHRFESTNRPLLFVTSDGLQVYILKGVYRFTDRGFIR